MSKIIILTGKTGVGKTTLIKQLAYPHTIIVDDYIKKHFYQSPHPLFTKIVKRFGPHIVEDKTINTTLLGQIIFQNKAKAKQLLAELDALVFPYLRKWLIALHQDQNPNLVLIEMATYPHHEAALKDYVDYVVLLTNKTINLSNKFPYLTTHQKHQLPLVKASPRKVDLTITPQNGLAQLRSLLTNWSIKMSD